MSDSRYRNPYLLRENIDWTDLADGYVLSWSATLGRFEFVPQGGPTGDPGLVGTKSVDESAIGNGKLIAYNSGTGTLEYVDPPTGGTPQVWQPIVVPLASRTTLAPGGWGTVQISSLILDATDWIGKSATIHVLAHSVGSSGQTVAVKLWNLTDSDLVWGDETTSTTPVELTYDIGVGNRDGWLRVTPTLYELTVTTDSTVQTDTAVVGSAYLRIGEVI